MSILILTDSRGRALQRAMEKFDIAASGFTVQVWAYSGRRIAETVSACLNEIDGQTFNIIYLSTGVNNLTNYHGSHNVTPAYVTWSTLVRELMIEYYDARKRLLPFARKVIVCELVGINIHFYNFSQGNKFEVEQDLLNRGVLRVKEYIEEMNDYHNMVSPAIEERVHKRLSTTVISHRYQETLIYGLHYTDALAYKILDRILVNTVQMFERMRQCYTSNN